MRLDTAAVRALNLMPPAGQESKQRILTNTKRLTFIIDNAAAMSVFGLLKRCRTAQGTRLLAQWLMQPLLDIKEIGK
jgi:DNA mismatch repair protein MSH2